jgi:hypothetical protein
MQQALCAIVFESNVGHSGALPVCTPEGGQRKFARNTVGGAFGGKATGDACSNEILVESRSSAYVSGRECFCF